MLNLSGYDEWASLTAEMAALGAVNHYTPEVYIPNKGYYRDAQHHYTLAEDHAYSIAVVGLRAEKERAYWHTNLVAQHLSTLLGCDVNTSPKGYLRLLRAVGDYIEHTGYPRHITAKVLCVYSHYLHATIFPLPPNMTTADHIRHCADLVLLTGLTFEQQIDAARWQIDLAALSDLLNKGAPYLLAKEMFRGKPTAVTS